MKRDEADKVIAELGKLISGALGGEVSVEVIKVPEGRTIEDVMKERNDPNWCDACGVVHKGDTDESIDVKKAKAVLAIDQRCARLQQAIDKLRELQTSIAQPNEERKPTTTMREIMMAVEIERMIDAL